MLSYLNRILLKKNILVNTNNNIHYDISNFNAYQSIFNACKKHLLNKEIKFDNIATKKKNKYNENIISTNFIVNNLLNILKASHLKKYFYVHRNTNIQQQKKKLDKNVILKSFNSLANKKQINIEKNKKTYKIFKNNKTLKHYIDIKNKYFLFDNYSNINLFNKSYKKNIFNTNNNLNIIKNKKHSVQDDKNFMHCKNYTNNRYNILSSKNVQKNQNVIFEINTLKKTDENHCLKLHTKSKFILNSKENMQWKKAISQNILLAIANKENQAEIHLKPEFLGSIYIQIIMKKNQAQLKFNSDHIEIKNFLNSCIPFLRDSLIKNDIFLKKVNIYSSLDPQKNKNLFVSECNVRASNLIKKFYNNIKQNKVIDMYI